MNIFYLQYLISRNESKLNLPVDLVDSDDEKVNESVVKSQQFSRLKSKKTSQLPVKSEAEYDFNELKASSVSSKSKRTIETVVISNDKPVKSDEEFFAEIAESDINPKKIKLTNSIASNQSKVHNYFD